MRLRTLPLALALFLAAASCGKSPYYEYKDNDLQLVTGYAAKEYCSCIFVMEQTEAFCTAWTRADPQVDTVRVDRASKTVEATALLMWGAKARYVDDTSGCVVQN